LLAPKVRAALALADCLRPALTTGKSAWQLALTIRTNSIPEPQGHPPRNRGRTARLCHGVSVHRVIIAA
jgi:hypothetical protein